MRRDVAVPGIVSIIVSSMETIINEEFLCIQRTSTQTNPFCTVNWCFLSCQHCSHIDFMIKMCDDSLRRLRSKFPHRPPKKCAIDFPLGSQEMTTTRYSEERSSYRANIESLFVDYHTDSIPAVDGWSPFLMHQIWMEVFVSSPVNHRVSNIEVTFPILSNIIIVFESPLRWIDLFATQMTNRDFMTTIARDESHQRKRYEHITCLFIVFSCNFFCPTYDKDRKTFPISVCRVQ